MKKTLVLLILTFLCLCAAAQTREECFSNDEISVYTVLPERALVTVTKAEPKGITCVCAYNIDIGEGFDGRVYVELSADAETDSLRLARIDGRVISAVNAEFTDGKALFYTDVSGTFALIDVNENISGGADWTQALWGIPALLALALLAVYRLRRKA